MRTPAERIAALIGMAGEADTDAPLAKTVGTVKSLVVKDEATLDALIDEWERDRARKHAA
jgi:hypothetical protein